MTPMHRLAAATTLAAGLAAVSGGAMGQTALAAQTVVVSSSTCPNPCNGPGGQTETDRDGGLGVSNSQSALANIDGTGRAAAMLTGQVNLPILRAEAFAAADRSSRVLARAAGMQGFYVGFDGLTSYDLEVALTGRATGEVQAEVLVFRDLNPASLPMFSAERGAMQFEVIARTPDLQLVQQLSLPLRPIDGTSQTIQTSLGIEELAAGDLFYIWARLSASGENGSYGDAFNTLNLSYVDATGLSQLAPVPEPGTWALLAAGLAGLAWRRRSRSAGHCSG